MNGKSKCKILKDIRRQIAQDNDIEFVTAECKYQGDCSGTCPKCEAEVRYLEQELAKRQAAGKAIAVAGIAAALVFSTAGCGMDANSTSHSTAGDPQPPASTSQTDPSLPEPGYPGEVPITGPTDPTDDVLTGEPVQTDPTLPQPGGAVPYSTEEIALTGDIISDVEYSNDPLPDDYYMLPGAIVAP